MIESACMMLDYIDEKNTAKKIRKAIAEVIQDGKIRTYDMMRMTGHPEVVNNGAASTIQMTDAIISKIR
jgi:3-isopropylmalate dehydrogenase